MLNEGWIAPIAAASVVTFGNSEVCALSNTTYRQVGGPGDVSSKLTEYSIEQNRRIVRGVRDPGERSEATIRLLADRGLTYDRALELIALHPTNGEKRRNGICK